LLSTSVNVTNAKFSTAQLESQKEKVKLTTSSQFEEEGTLVENKGWYSSQSPINLV
jgi:hypothetical protein